MECAQLTCNRCSGINERRQIASRDLTFRHDGLVATLAYAVTRLPEVLIILGHYQYDLNLRDIAAVWRRGSAISPRLLDLTAAALVEDPGLSKFAGRVPDSGEGRRTNKAAVDDRSARRKCISASVCVGNGIGDEVLSSVRYQIGGHVENAERITA